jgi:geranylgeranyl transferase type-2 subunit alpha
MSALDSNNPHAPEILSPCTNEDRVHYLEQELDSVQEMLDGAEDCKYIYQALLEYAPRYFEVEAGNKKVTTAEMREWLDELRKIDPLRAGRWDDLARTLKL